MSETGTERDDSAPGQLGARAARGAAITLSGQGARILLQTLSVVVLARLLSPSDYGLVAMVLAIVGVGEIFRDFGLSSAAIQAKSLSHAQRSALFWLNSAIGLGLGLLVVAASPLIAHLYGHPEVGPIARVLALTFVFNGVATQLRADLNRRLQFVKLTVSDVVSPGAGLALAVVGAAAGWGYWALVAQQLAQSLALLVMLAAFARFVPGRPRRGAGIGGMVRFGGHLVGSQLVGYVAKNIDTVMIGVRFGTAPLGIYNRGYQLLMTPLSQLRAPTTTVALPVLSRLVDDERRYVAFVTRGQLALGYTMVAGLGVVIGASDLVTSVFLGDGWDGVAPVLGLLALAGGFQTLAYVGYWVYLSRGLTDALLRYTLVSALIQIVCIVVGSSWGIVGVASGFAVATAIEWPISLVWLTRLTGLPLRPLITGAVRIVVVTAVVAVASAVAGHAWSAPPDAVRLLLALAGGATGYGLLLALVPLFRDDFRAILDTGRMVLHRKVTKTPQVH